MYKKIFYWFDEVERILLNDASNDRMHITFLGHGNNNIPTEAPYLDEQFTTTNLVEAQNLLYDKISKLDPVSINKYIQLSYNQLITHSPVNRYQVLLDTFWYDCFAPEEPNRDIDEEHISFFNLYFNAYKKTFHLYESFIKDIYSDYKNGFLVPKIPNTTIPQELKPESFKLRTNLSVPQLAYLFNLLNDLNPKIFELNAKTDLSDFIANNFVTKATEKNGISSKSVYNLFSNVDKETANFWVDKLKKMLEQARKV